MVKVIFFLVSTNMADLIDLLTAAKNIIEVNSNKKFLSEMCFEEFVDDSFSKPLPCYDPETMSCNPGDTTPYDPESPPYNPECVINYSKKFVDHIPELKKVYKNNKAIYNIPVQKHVSKGNIYCINEFYDTVKPCLRTDVIGALYYICHCCTVISASHGAFPFDKDRGAIKYTLEVFGGDVSRVCSAPVARIMCLKASIIILTWANEASLDSEYNDLTNAMNYACMMWDTEPDERAKCFRYILEMSTIFNMFVPWVMPNFPEFYLFPKAVFYKYIAAFGEYSPFDSDYFSEHISTTPKLESNIGIEDNVLYYIPTVTPVKEKAREYVRESLNMLQVAKGVKNILHAYLIATTHELHFKVETKEQCFQNDAFNFRTPGEAIRTMVPIPAYFEEKVRKKYKGRVTLMGVFKINNSIQNVFIKNINPLQAN
jgi:hypothetical protein